MNYENSIEVRNSLLNRVFLHMIFGIIITAVTSYFFYSNEVLTDFVTEYYTAIIITQLVVAFGVNLCLFKIAPSIVQILYYLYCALTGVTFCILGYIFEPTSIALILLVTFGIFTIMAIYGRCTKEDLSKYSTFFKIGLLILVIVSLINLFLKSSMLEWGISVVSVVIFTGLIAYDVNKISMISEYADTKEEGKALAIYGAFSLYLDFINLFINLLRLFGRKR